MAVKDKVDKLLRPIIEGLGYELVEITYKKEYGTPTLTCFIDTDKEGGIGLDDCETVSRAIDPVLDENDPTDGEAYNLNVSSPGLDRPLTLERDFVKNKGKEVEASFYAPYQGKKKLQGILLDWSETQVVLQSGKDIHTIEKKAIAVLKPVIKF